MSPRHVQLWGAIVVSPSCSSQESHRANMLCPVSSGFQTRSLEEEAHTHGAAISSCRVIDSCQLRVLGGHEVSPWPLLCSETQPGLISANISFQPERHSSIGSRENLCTMSAFLHFVRLCISSLRKESSGARSGCLGPSCSLSPGSALS